MRMMSLPVTTKHRLAVTLAAIGFALALAGIATAGQFEDGMDALRRGDAQTASRLLGPLAAQGDPRAQWALGGSMPVHKAGPPPPQLPSPLIVLAPLATFLGLGAFALGVKWHLRRTQLAQATRVATFIKNLPPEVLADVERANQVAKQRPWRPIAFSLESVEAGDASLQLRASGEHRGHAFGFAITLTMSYGPVAICEWSRSGAASDGLIDILAEYADVPRADHRFDPLVRTSLIVLTADPPNVPFAQIARLNCKVFFELTEGNPEIYLDLDLSARSGSLREKDAIYRKDLVRAFQKS
jgi:hypothetical protein